MDAVSLGELGRLFTYCVFNHMGVKIEERERTRERRWLVSDEADVALASSGRGLSRRITGQ